MKKRSHLAGFIGLLTACLTGLLSLEAFGEEEVTYYVENEWNYVDGSMDTEGGIPEDASGVLGQIQRSGCLKVAIEPNHAPYCSLDEEGNPVGADVELARLIASRMGVELVLLPMDSTQILPALTEGQCDLSISAISYTPSRALYYTMSKGYYAEDLPKTGILIQKERQGEIQSPEDLENKILVVQSNSIQEVLGARYVDNYSEYRRVPYLPAVFEAVVEGTVDAALVNLDTAGRYLKNNPGSGLCLVEGVELVPEEQYLGFRVAAKKGEMQLVYFVNGVIDEVLAGGLYEQWLEAL